MIDTKELRANARAVGIKNWFGMDGSRAVEIANELDRLYELERRTTQLTREQIEAELVRRGFVLIEEIGKQREYQVLSGDKCITVVTARIWHNDGVSIDVAGKQGMFVTLDKGILTLQLLDAVLEAK